jgi:aspartate oxidase
VRTDLSGASSLPGLYACGETACTGVHGANRLASNSLLEGLVFGRRIAETVVASLGDPRPPASVGTTARPGLLVDDRARPQVQQVMSRYAGVLREHDGLTEATADLEALIARQKTDVPRTENWEATNVHTVATALVHAAALRRETRGSHWREDYPALDAEWAGHLDLTLRDDGALAVQFVPGGAS